MKRLTAFLTLFACLCTTSLPEPATAGPLPNGIELPQTWPPRVSLLPDALPTPPYLTSPPSVIPIDLGRQLFVDDFLVEKTTLTRRFHRPVYHPANPILTPDREWEKARDTPMAQPFSGGVWFDPADGKFKMWYMGGYTQHLCYAESKDGVAWTKPALDTVKGTNIVLPGGATESNTVWLDLKEKDPKRRVKFFTHRGGAIGNMYYRASPDGLRGWSDEVWKSGRCGDRTTVFFNPFLDRWVLNVRESFPPGQRGRSKRYWEVGDINDPAAVNWPAQDKVPLWVTADRGLDVPNVAIGVPPQLYHLDCVAYESVMLGLFSILRGNHHADSGDGREIHPGRPKHNDVCVGFSRDGFHWHRPSHEVFLPISDRKGDWNWGNVQSVGGGVLVVGDYLYLYCSGRAGEARCKGNPLCVDAFGSTGLAVLRRDGFASMEAGTEEGTLTTRKVRFTGKHLLVNANVSAGEMRVEVLDAEGRVIAPFTKEACFPVRTNRTLERVTWKGSDDLAKLAGKEVRFRFSMRGGHLYSFWVSPDNKGASQGYIGAGGPGFASHQDTMGIAAYKGNRPPLVDAGVDQVVRADDKGMVEVTLDGSRSVDHDGKVQSYEWRQGDKLVAGQGKATARLPVGVHTLTLTIKDNDGAAGVGGIRVRVLPRADLIPPRDRLVLWVKADAIQGVKDGAPVTIWSDSSGNSLDPFQPDAAKRPHWKEKAVNGLPAVRFDGTDDNLQTRYYRDLMMTSYRVSAFAVFRPVGNVESRGLVSSSFTALATTRDQGGGLVFTTAYLSGEGKNVWKDVRPTGRGTVQPDRWTVASVVRSGDRPNQTRLRVNGTRVDDGTAIAYHTVNTKNGFIGCLRNEAGCWKGDIAEILVYADALPEDERRAVEQYLARKYGFNLEKE